MRKPNLIESLEARQHLSASIGVTDGVQPQAGTPGIALGPNNLYFNAVKGSSSTYQLRVTNTGTTGRLLLKADAFRVAGGTNPNSFKVIDFPSTGRSIAPGAMINVTVQFNPSGSASKAIQTAQLRVYSNVPSKKGFAIIPLRGMPTAGTGGSLEPSLQKIFDLFSLPIKSGETDPDNYHFPTSQPTNTDEISGVSTFVKAGAGDVSVVPLAVFTNAATPAVRTGFYTPGNLDSQQNLWYVPGDTSQSVNPFYYGRTKFDPGSGEFGIATQYPAFVNKDGSARVVYSEDTLNRTFSDSSTYHHSRVYPFIRFDPKDPTKQITVPNAYIVAQEEYDQTSVADNNDLIYVITNVKPAASSPTLSVENVAGFPDNDTLVFNKVQIPNADAPNLTRESNTLRIRNSGKTSLVISLQTTGEYSITSGGGSNITIAPGDKHDVVVKFTSTTGANDGIVKSGTLTITSNDATTPSKVITLNGYWEKYSEQSGPGAGSVEPTASEIVNGVFGYTTNVGTGSALNSHGNTAPIVGDEINVQYFKIADGDGDEARVRVTELADFHSQTFVDEDTGEIKPTGSNMGWFRQGSSSNSTILTDKEGTGQMILPTPKASNANGVTFGSFKPGNDTFGFEVEGREYSDYSKNNPDNTPGFGKFLRFFVAYDKNGVVIPNTYIVLHDYNTATVNYDFNDNVYLISNVIPVGAVKTPVTASAVRSGVGARVFFTSPTDGPKITGFNIYRSTSPRGTYALLTGTPLNARPGNAYQDDTATASTPYYYAIESVGQDGGKSQRVVVKVS